MRLLSLFVFLSLQINQTESTHVALNNIKLPCSNLAFSEGITTLISNSVRHAICPSGKRCPVSILCAVVTVEGSWERWGRPYCACQSQEGKEKALLSNHLSGFDVTKDGRAQLKGHYCVSKSTPIKHNHFKQMILTRLHRSHLFYAWYLTAEIKIKDAVTELEGMRNYVKWKQYFLFLLCTEIIYSTVCFTANSADHVCQPVSNAHELFCWSPNMPLL